MGETFTMPPAGIFTGALSPGVDTTVLAGGQTAVASLGVQPSAMPAPGMGGQPPPMLGIDGFAGVDTFRRLPAPPPVGAGIFRDIHATLAPAGHHDRHSRIKLLSSFMPGLVHGDIPLRGEIDQLMADARANGKLRKVQADVVSLARQKLLARGNSRRLKMNLSTIAEIGLLPAPSEFSEIRARHGLPKFLPLDELANFFELSLIKPDIIGEEDCNAFADFFAMNDEMIRMTRTEHNTEVDSTLEDHILRQNPKRSRSVTEMTSNAIDAMREGRIPIQVEIEDGHYAVRDRGIGMAPRIFLKKLLVAIATGKEDAGKTIGRFGIGFFTALAHLQTPKDYVLVETKGEDSAGYILLFRKIGGKICVHIENAPEITETGTTVNVHSSDISKEVYEKELKDNIEFHYGNPVCVNGAAVNSGERRALKDVSKSRLVLQRSKGRSQSVVTIGGVRIQSDTNTGENGYGTVVWDLPRATGLSEGRHYVRVDSDAVRDEIRALIGAVDTLPSEDRLPYLSTIAPLVEKLQDANNSKHKNDNLMDYLLNKTADIARGSKLVPDTPIHKALSTDGCSAVHPILLPEDWIEKAGGFAPPEWTDGGDRLYVIPMKGDCRPFTHDREKGLVFISEELYANGRESLPLILGLPPGELKGRWRKIDKTPAAASSDQVVADTRYSSALLRDSPFKDIYFRLPHLLELGDEFLRTLPPTTLDLLRRAPNGMALQDLNLPVLLSDAHPVSMNGVIYHLSASGIFDEKYQKIEHPTAQQRIMQTAFKLERIGAGDDLVIDPNGFYEILEGPNSEKSKVYRGTGEPAFPFVIRGGSFERLGKNLFMASQAEGDKSDFLFDQNGSVLRECEGILKVRDEPLLLLVTEKRKGFFLDETLKPAGPEYDFLRGDYEFEVHKKKGPQTVVYGVRRAAGGRILDVYDGEGELLHSFTEKELGTLPGRPGVEKMGPYLIVENGEKYIKHCLDLRTGKIEEGMIKQAGDYFVRYQNHRATAIIGPDGRTVYENKDGIQLFGRTTLVQRYDGSSGKNRTQLGPRLPEFFLKPSPLTGKFVICGLDGRPVSDLKLDEVREKNQRPYNDDDSNKKLPLYTAILHTDRRGGYTTTILNDRFMPVEFEAETDCEMSNYPNWLDHETEPSGNFFVATLKRKTPLEDGYAPSRYEMKQFLMAGMERCGRPSDPEKLRAQIDAYLDEFEKNPHSDPSAFFERSGNHGHMMAFEIFGRGGPAEALRWAHRNHVTVVYDLEGHAIARGNGDGAKAIKTNERITHFLIGGGIFDTTGRKISKKRYDWVSATLDGKYLMVWSSSGDKYDLLYPDGAPVFDRSFSDIASGKDWIELVEMDGKTAFWLNVHSGIQVGRDPSGPAGGDKWKISVLSKEGIPVHGVAVNDYERHGRFYKVTHDHEEKNHLLSPALGENLKDSDVVRNLEFLAAQDQMETAFSRRLNYIALPPALFVEMLPYMTRLSYIPAERQAADIAKVIRAFSGASKNDQDIFLSLVDLTFKEFGINAPADLADKLIAVINTFDTRTIRQFVNKFKHKKSGADWKISKGFSDDFREFNEWPQILAQIGFFLFLGRSELLSSEPGDALPSLDGEKPRCGLAALRGEDVPATTMKAVVTAQRLDKDIFSKVGVNPPAATIGTIEAKTHGADTSHMGRKILHAAYHSADPARGLYLREFIQNALDSLTAAGRQGSEIPISVYENLRGECVLRLKDDGIGMSLEDVFNFFLVPGKSKKRGFGGMFIGGRGVGFFTAYPGAKKIRLKTGTGDGKTHHFTLTPVYRRQDDGSEKIVDVEIRWKTVDEDFKGTTVERISSEPYPQLEAAKLHRAIKTHARLIDPDDAVVTFNGRQINEDTELLATVDVQGLGAMRFYRSKENALTAGGLFVKGIPGGLLSDLPPMIQEMFARRGLVIDLPRGTRLTRERDDLENAEAQLNLFKPRIFEGGIRAYFKLVTTGEESLRELPYDFFNRLEINHLSMLARNPDISRDAALINEGKIEQLADLSRYCTDQAVTDLLCLLKIFPYDGEVLSLVEIGERIHRGEKMDLDKLPPQIKDLVDRKEQARAANAEHETTIRRISGESGKTADELKIEWFPRADTAPDLLFAHQRISELILGWLGIHGIKVGYSTILGSVIAYTRRGSDAIFWNPASIMGDLGRLKKILSAPEPQEDEVSDLIRSMTETLSHETVHAQRDYPIEATHNRGFFIKQRGLLLDATTRAPLVPGALFMRARAEIFGRPVDLAAPDLKEFLLSAVQGH